MRNAYLLRITGCGLNIVTIQCHLEDGAKPTADHLILLKEE